MFAVPGWSVKAENLKSEKEAGTGGSGGGGGGSKSKRKRRGSGHGHGDVRAENVGDMWERVMEGKIAPAKEEDISESNRRRRNKKHKRKGDEGVGAMRIEPPEQQAGEATLSADTNGKKDKKKDKRRRERKVDDYQESSSPQEPQQEKEHVSKPTPKELVPLPLADKLTPLQKAMRAKLIPARFRHLNETLYTRPSTEAVKLFDDSPELFNEYHAGFRQQVSVWPENPVDGYIAAIRLRGAAHFSSHHTQPLPRAPDRLCTVADLGCGDARLAASLEKQKKKLRLDIRSFDLQVSSPLVTKADIANLPLADGSVNVAIFCLALMGTNWLAFVEEAWRVLRWNGELWVAEIKSRFGRVRGGKHGIVPVPVPVPHSLGNQNRNPQKAASLKRAAAKREAEAEAVLGRDLEVEVDGQDDARNATDVSAFVEALRKRGFVLNRDRGDAAVDLSNKMFVRMYFVKGAAPTVGKCVDHEKLAQMPPKKKVWAADLIDGEGEEEADESKILKPCVYKLR